MLERGMQFQLIVRHRLTCIRRCRITGGTCLRSSKQMANGEVWLLLVYDKTGQETIPLHVLRMVREEIENG